MPSSPEEYLRSGARAIAFAVLAALAAFLPVSSPAAAAKRFALVIGNSGYEHAPELENPRNDAALMRDTLETSGFSVTTLIDADYRSLKRALVEFGRSLRGGDIEAGLFYYAGHGVQVRGENYLIPVNAAITSEDEVDLEAINVNDFLRVMNSSDAAVNIVILDACRDNPFKGSSRSMSRGLAPVDAPKGTYIAYATAPGEVALDGAGGNSPYTSALTRAMAQPGVPIERVFKNARVAVLEETGEKQVPWEVSSITGEFYFQQRSAAPRDDAEPSRPATQANLQGSAERAFHLAEEANTVAAWQAYLSQFGAASEFYGSLARERLAALERQQNARSSLERPAYPGESCGAYSRQLLGGSLCVTSVLTPQSGNRYDGGNLLDDDPATAWVEGVDGNGEGQALILDFERPTAPRTIEIVNGYNKSRDIFEKNARLRTMGLMTSEDETFDFTVDDRMGWQTIHLPALRPARWIGIWLTGVYPGSRYQDTAISEIRLK